ncbi:MAG: inositol monophosphatase family protein [Myxococcota bacterium]
MTVNTALTESLTQTTRRAGELLREMQRGPLQVDEKGRSDLVTDADRAAESLVRARLEERWPGARLILEEGGTTRAPGTGHERLCFIIDPLDGTTNFAATLPHFAVAIGVEEEGRGLVAGCVYDPFRDEMFVAERGHGAWLNDRRLHVSATDRLRDSVLATGFAYDRYTNPDDNHAEFAAVNLSCRGVRRFGAATLDLAWVAAGRLDGFWERGLRPWDLAPGVVLIEEAGGKLSRYDGRPAALDVPDVVASNGHLHQELCDAVVRARAAAGRSPCPADTPS